MVKVLVCLAGVEFWDFSFGALNGQEEGLYVCPLLVSSPYSNVHDK